MSWTFINATNARANEPDAYNTYATYQLINGTWYRVDNVNGEQSVTPYTPPAEFTAAHNQWLLNKANTEFGGQVAGLTDQQKTDWMLNTILQGDKAASEQDRASSEIYDDWGWAVPILAPIAVASAGALAGAAGAAEAGALGGIDAGLGAFGDIAAADVAAGLTPEFGSLGTASGWGANAITPSWQDIFSGAEQAGSTGVDFSSGMAPTGGTGMEGSWQDIFSGAEQAGTSGVDFSTGMAPSAATTTNSLALFPQVTEFLKANPWALPLVGTLLGGATSGGTQSQTTSTSTAAPPAALTGALSGAASLLPGGASAGGSLAGSPNNLGLAGQSLAETMLGNFMLPSTWNPYGGQTTQVPTNPYYGQNNPYLQGVIDRSAGDVTSRIQSQFNRPGGYGGSANQEILARELGNLNNQIRYQDYGLQANLGEADVNRRLNTSLQDIMRNAGLWNTDIQRNTSNYQAERGRQLSAALGTPGFQTGVTESLFAPYQQYANLYKGWGQQQTTQYPQPSTAQGALGGALSGYALSRMFG